MTVQATVLAVDLPMCRYLTPAARRGWKGIEARGEDADCWYDSEGVRNGPPRNYWRQASDERMHTHTVEAITHLVDSGSTAAAMPSIEALENRMGITKPLLNQKLLGTWAPVLYRGSLVASLVDTAAPRAISCTITATRQLVVPATLSLQRLGERRTKTNGYGTTDAHLQPGEAIRLTLAGPGAFAESSLPASGENERQHVRWERHSGRLLATGLPGLPGRGVPLGRISLLNEYLLVQRDTSGKLREVWLRCDEQPRFLARSDRSARTAQPRPDEAAAATHDETHSP